MTDLEFEIIGHPQPAGSKRAFAVRQAGQLTGRVAVADDNPRSRSWKNQVAEAAARFAHAQRVDGLLAGPLALEVTFTLARPVGHYGSGRNRHRLRPTAPDYPAVRPDVTKLLRGVEDALTGVLWRDDAQIVTQTASKRYGSPEGARVAVRTLEHDERAPPLTAA